MVQPLPPASASGRPDCASGRPNSKSVTTGKYDEFRSYFQRLSQRVGAQQAAPPGPESQASTSPAIKREISPELDPTRSLAPEAQPSLGGGGADLAEWLSLINPAGGLEGPTALPSVAPPATPHLGVAEVAELVERWVRRVALGGDQRRGAVRLDIGQGRFSGAELLVVAEAGHVSVELQLPPSMAQGDLSARLRARLERRGYEAKVLVR